MMKVLAEIDLREPLMQGAKMKLEDELIQADFKYEKLPTFGFYCGIIGHQDKNCGKKLKDSEGQIISES